MFYKAIKPNKTQTQKKKRKINPLLLYTEKNNIYKLKL